VYYRALYTLPIRLMRYSFMKVSDQPTSFRYDPLVPNYTHHWVEAGDSDAVNDMDPNEALLWFISRGDICLNRSTFLEQYLVRNGPLIFKIQK
jgi:hypothetical protein